MNYEKGSVFTHHPDLYKQWKEAELKDFNTLSELLKIKAQREGGLISFASKDAVRRIRYHIINELAEPGSEFHQKLWSNINNTDNFYKLLLDTDYTKTNRFRNLQELSTEEQQYFRKVELAKAIKFIYAPDIARFMVQIKDDRIDHLVLSDQICYVLGYEVQSELKNNDIARYSCDLKGGVSFLCCYTDIVEDLPFGDVMSPLLQIIAVTGKPGI